MWNLDSVSIAAAGQQITISSFTLIDGNAQGLCSLAPRGLR
jgi:hypothetical protein